VRAKRQKDKMLVIRDKFQNLSNNDEYKELAEEAFKELEEQSFVIEKLQADLDEALLENFELDDRLDNIQLEKKTLEYRLDKLQETKVIRSNGIPLLIRGEEIELFDGEFEAIILKILSEYKNNLAITQRQKKILEDIISANPSCEDTALYVDKIKSIFSGYDGVTPKILQELKELKLEIVDGNTHTSIKIIDDPRFEVCV
jgi:predicted nuclease with TOPRIM domain